MKIYQQTRQNKNKLNEAFGFLENNKEADAKEFGKRFLEKNFQLLMKKKQRHFLNL